MRYIAFVAFACSLLLQACASTPAAPPTARPTMQKASATPQPTLPPQPSAVPPTNVPTAVAVVQKTLDFDSLSAITVATDGTIYLGGWRNSPDRLLPTLWGYSAAGKLTAFEGDEAGYTTSIQSYTALAPAENGAVLALDAQMKQVWTLAPRAERADGSFPIEPLIPTDALDSGADLTDLAVTNTGELLVLQADHAEVQRFSNVGRRLSTWSIVQGKQPSFPRPRAIAYNGATAEVAVGATLQRYTMAGDLLGTWQLPGADACPGVADDQAYAHQGIGDLVIDAEGRRFVADMGCGPAHTGARILVLDQDWQQVAAWPIGDNRYPEGLAIDPDGRVYVLTHVIHAGTPDAVLIFNQQGNLEAQWRGQE